MRPALVVNHRVDFVDDQRPHSAQHLSAAVARQQDVKRLGRGDDDVRRLLRHGRAILRGSIAGADQRANFDVRYARSFEVLLNAFEGRLEIDFDVVAESLERRDVHDVRFITQFAARRFPNQIIDRGKKRCERLTRSGRHGYQRVLA